MGHTLSDDIYIYIYIYTYIYIYIHILGRGTVTVGIRPISLLTLSLLTLLESNFPGNPL